MTKRLNYGLVGLEEDQHYIVIFCISYHFWGINSANLIFALLVNFLDLYRARIKINCECFLCEQSRARSVFHRPGNCPLSSIQSVCFFRRRKNVCISRCVCVLTLINSLPLQEGFLSRVKPPPSKECVPAFDDWSSSWNQIELVSTLFRSICNTSLLLISESQLRFRVPWDGRGKWKPFKTRAVWKNDTHSKKENYARLIGHEGVRDGIGCKMCFLHASLLFCIECARATFG